jgi:hypothetical protein
MTDIDIVGMRDVGAGIWHMGQAFEKISDGVYLAGIGIVLMGPMVGIASIIRAVRGTRKHDKHGT